jgi:hypothetical protein
MGYKPMTKPTMLLMGILETCGLERAVIGDLEECRADRSALWFWRQVLWAVAVQTWRGTRRHPVLTTRALLVGWGMFVISQRAGLWLALRIGPTETRWMPFADPPRMGFAVVNEALWSVCLLAISFTAAAAAGFAVARTHRQVQTGILAFGFSVVAVMVYTAAIALLAAPRDGRSFMILGLTGTVIVAMIAGALLGTDRAPITSAERAGSSARRR